jgi:hypothetical protein
MRRSSSAPARPLTPAAARRPRPPLPAPRPRPPALRVRTSRASVPRPRPPPPVRRRPGPPGPRPRPRSPRVPSLRGVFSLFRGRSGPGPFRFRFGGGFVAAPFGRSTSRGRTAAPSFGRLFRVAASAARRRRATAAFSRVAVGGGVVRRARRRSGLGPLQGGLRVGEGALLAAACNTQIHAYANDVR